MSLEKILSLFAAVIIFLFGLFPESEFLSRTYGMFYDWSLIEEKLETAVESGDSEKLAEMACPSVKEKYSDLENRIDAVFDKISGKALKYEKYSEFETTETDYSYHIKTDKGDFVLKILYRGIHAASKQEDVGISRILVYETKDDGSGVIIPELLIYSDNLNSPFELYTREWTYFSGNAADELSFIVVQPETADTGNGNIRIHANRCKTEQTHYALHKDDKINVYVIPEGEGLPSKDRKPDLVITHQLHPDICYLNVKPGKYYLYAECSDPEADFGLSVLTNI